jgi:hypothetical protein
MQKLNDYFGGLYTGVVISLGVALILLPILFSKVFEFDISQPFLTLLLIFGIICLIISFPIIGVIPVITKKINNYKEAIKVGIINGIISSLIVFTLIGSVCYSLTFGVVPFVEFLVDTNKLFNIDPINAVLRPIVKNVITSTYLIIIAHLIIGTIVGAVEAITTVYILSIREKKKQTA